MLIPENPAVSGLPSHAAGGSRSVAEALCRSGAIGPETLRWAEARGRRHAASLGDVLVRNGLLDEDVVFRAMARVWNADYTDLVDRRVDPAALRRIGPGYCARRQILPLLRAGSLTPVAVAKPERFAALRSEIEPILGPVAMVVAPESRLERLIQRLASRELSSLAETRCPVDQSCRTLPGRRVRWLIATALAAFLAAAAVAPVGTIELLCILSFGVVFLNSVVLAAALAIATLRKAVPNGGPPPVLARLPKVSLLLPLHREADIAGKLLERMARIDYPRECLDVLLIVESDDRITRDAIARADIPPWIRTVRVGPGEIRTKPRAMNVALDFCRGSIIGVYDAEDAPHAAQIRDVVDRFARSGPRVACLQGRLGFYNTRTSWITRCFAIDYATWFWIVLPALRTFGWPVPLGGTTVFFRREAIEAVGAWDAHNVTEDADLGVRLARAGYVTDLIDSVTFEEATARPVPWIRQRSRWQKGYALTWASHMRNPAATLRDLGPWSFVGLQVLFLGSLSSAILAPVMWSFWLIFVGLDHPFTALTTPVAQFALAVGFLLILIVNTAAGAVALARQGRTDLVGWLPVMHVYQPLATISIVKALAELVRRPFFWDKTAHAVTQPDSYRPASWRASWRSRVS
jgi:glycosyltransferase XagB